jgi:hypothetical protein
VSVLVRDPNWRNFIYEIYCSMGHIGMPILLRGEGEVLAVALSSKTLSYLLKVGIRGCIQKFPGWVDNEIIIIINTRRETAQRVMAAKLTRLTHEGLSKSFRTDRLEREVQMVQFSATRCSCIAILSVSLVTFASITLCVASQWVFIVVRVYFVIDSVRKLLDTTS